MYRWRNRQEWSLTRFPHVRGDVPRTGGMLVDSQAISPRAWGCTGGITWTITTRQDFPTCVGMYRRERRSVEFCAGFPHVRGDVPLIHRHAAVAGEISPRAWGCTAEKLMCPFGNYDFPTCVGMYRVYRWSQTQQGRFPHVRGDVPQGRPVLQVQFSISPRAWGCTVSWLFHRRQRPDFPTCVGMYRINNGSPLLMGRFPHVRGDEPN